MKYYSLIILFLISISFASAQTNWNSNLNNGLIHFFYADCGNSRMSDFINTSVTGVLSLGASCVTNGTKDGVGYISFNGINNFVNFSNMLNIPYGGNDLTIIMDINETTNVLYQNLLGTNGTNPDAFAIQSGAGSPSPLLVYNKNSNLVTTSNGIINDGSKWIEIAFKMNSSGSFGYLNGLPSGSSGTTSNLLNGFYTMGLGGAEGGVYFNGSIYKFAVWNRSLSDSEILNVNNSYFNRSIFTININYPLNNANLISPISFNCSTSSPSNNIQNISLYLNGNLNYTLIGGTQKSLELDDSVNLINGNYNYSCSAWDNSTSQVNSTVNFFNVTSFLIVPISYNSTSYETKSETFYFNLTSVVGIISVSANLIYNGTSYPTYYSCSSSSNCIISGTIDVPVSYVNYQNNSFYVNGTAFTSSSSINFQSNTATQEINKLNLGACNSTIPTPVLNFSVFDEDSLSSISPFSFQATFNYWAGSGSIYKTALINSLSTSTQIGICTDNNITYYSNANIQYGVQGNTSYNKRNYYLTNATLTNISNVISLYLLPVSLSTSFIDTALDTGRNGIPNAIIIIQRCEPSLSSCFTVQMLKTDSTGSSVGFYKTETVDYQHIIILNNKIVYSDSPHKIFATSAPYTNYFYVGGVGNITFIPSNMLPNLFTNLSYDNNSNLVTYTWIDTSGLFQSSRLEVNNINYSGINMNICNYTSSQSSGSLSCDMTNQSEGDYQANGFITRAEEILVNYITFSVSEAQQIFGKEGLFLGMFIILAAGMTFLFSPIAGVWMITVAMIFTNIVGLTAFGGIWIFGSIILSIIFTILFNQ